LALDPTGTTFALAAGVQTAIARPAFPSSDDLHRVALERLLQRSASCLVVCDTALRVLATAGGAERLLLGGELPTELGRVARLRLRDPVGVSRVILPNRRVVHVTNVEHATGPLVLIWLREETVRRPEHTTRFLRDRYGLAVRSQQLLALLREGLTNREIAERLELREGTVKTYLYELYRTLGVKNRTGALACVDRSLNSTDFR
jgi:DNA-binding CsgD family transcriptional regulator